MSKAQELAEKLDHKNVLVYRKHAHEAAALLRQQAEALSAVARIAHSGGLSGMSEYDALNAIRRTTLPYWDTTETMALTIARLKEQLK